LAILSGREFKQVSVENVSEAEKRRFVCERFGKHPDQLEGWLVLIQRSLDKMYQYGASEEEQFVDETMKRWGFDPDVLRTNCEKAGAQE